MMSNHQHGRIILRFESLALRSHLHRNEIFHYSQSRKITQQYKFSQEFLDPQVPHSVPQYLQSRARKLTPMSQPPIASYTTMNT